MLSPPIVIVQPSLSIHADDGRFLDDCWAGLQHLLLTERKTEWLSVWNTLSRWNASQQLDYFIHMEQMAKKGLPSAVTLMTGTMTAKLSK